MAGRSSAHEAIMDRRVDDAHSGEALFTKTREVQEGNGDLHHNIPLEAVGLLGLDKEATVKIDIYPNSYAVTVEEGGDEADE